MLTYRVCPGLPDVLTLRAPCTIRGLYLTEKVHKAVLQKSIPAHIRQRILQYD